MLQQIDDVPDKFIYRMVRHAEPQIARIAQQGPHTTCLVIVINAGRCIEIGETALAVRTLSVLRPHQELVCMGTNTMTAEPSTGDDRCFVGAIAPFLGVCVTDLAAIVIATGLPRVAWEI